MLVCNVSLLYFLIILTFNLDVQTAHGIILDTKERMNAFFDAFDLTLWISSITTPNGFSVA